ncbi:MAG: S8 family serine peptidase [Acidobacteriota bacterium]|nr:S8 family serine peptidase [Acidobacteriota bacterium]
MKRQKLTQCSNDFSRSANWKTSLKNVFAISSAIFVIAVLVVTLFIKPLASVAASGVANSVIVELKDDPAAVWKAKIEKSGGSVSDGDLQNYRNSLKAKQDQLLSALQSRGISYEVDGVDIKNFDGSTIMRADYRFNLVFNGITLKVPASAIPIIQSMPQVKSVQNNGYDRVLLDKSVPYINAPANYGQFPELTAFDNFREGYEGQGINIAVLDTGIDWTHPMFGGDPTPPRLGVLPPTAALNSNQKVIYYMSFSGGLLDDFGHGSHAAADAAGYLGMAPGTDGLPGTTDDRRMHGVAPQARLMGYKVCTGTGSCVNSSTILGIEDAVSPTTLTLQPKPVAHVINLSLGGAGTPDSATAVAASNAALLGTTVVASAGNSGPGEGTVGAPAAGRHVIAVGATTHPGAANANWSVDFLKSTAVPQNQVGAVTPAKNLPAQEGFDRLKLYPMAGAPDPAAGSVAQRYVFVTSGSTPVTYPASVRGRIALVKGMTSSGAFVEVANAAAAAGAIGVILVSTTTNPTALKATIPAAVISVADGEVLIDAISSTDNNAVNPPTGTISELPIRLNPFLTDEFVGETASFSSRGPVQGLGQVKPDITAPGVEVVAATSRVGGSTVPTPGYMFDPTGYIAASGTSFSGPQVAGAVAIIKQAHLNWSPDMIRASLINTATNLRTDNGTPKADNNADAINDQGGGLIDIAAAVRAKAIMGVEGDGIVNPAILASHSFGETPILNNRVSNTKEVTVTIKDVSGQGGTYNLSTVNNRNTNREGVVTSVSPSSIVVPPSGSATFTAKITVDGNVVRNANPTQFQWYIVANRGGSNDKLRMPMYLQATPSLPSDQIGSSETNTYTGTVQASDAGVQRDNEIYVAEGITYVDVPFEVSPSGLKIDATLSWGYTDVPEAGVGLPDLDFLLFDPNGTQIGSSGNSSGPEHIAANTTIPGTYVYRVYGWANGPTDFEISSTVLSGGAAPAVKAFASDFTLGNQRFDFDGNYTLNWEPRGSVEAYEVEESTDGNNWSVVRAVDGNTTSVAFSNVGDGTRNYRVRSITPGRIGKYVTIPSNTESITVARRVATDVTSTVTPVNKSIVFPAGSTEIVTALKNDSGSTLYPTIRAEIISVQSSGNSVSVANADNGGNGISTPAVFDYSNLVGADFAPNEESGTRMIKFNNPNTVLFTYTVRITAHVPAGASSTTTTTSGTSTSGGTTSTTGGTSTGSGTNTTGGSQLLQFTVNPLTGSITQLLK